MASSSSLPSSNPFGPGSSFAKISEEEEYDVTSPTDPSFRRSHTTSQSPFSSEAGPDEDEDENNNNTQINRNIFASAYQDSGEGLSSADLSAALSNAGGPGQGMPNNYAMGRRTSVSAESLNPTSSGADSWTPPFHPKTDEQLSRLKKAVSGNFLFSHLDDEHLKTVLDALVEKPIPAKGIKVITQGDAGDYFYIVEEGTFGVFINPSGAAQPGPDGLGTQVGSIGPGGSFGELALMYNAPRAATIVSLDPKSTLWALDRITFRRILMDSAFQRRRMYEAFLEEVPLLSSLKPYERSKIADALDTIKYAAGSTIIREGDPGDSFYLLESGEAEAVKAGTTVKEYSRGGYFGELALLDEKPRAASVIAKTDVKVARLGRDGFKRLLGPVEQIMRRTEYDVDPAGTPTTIEWLCSIYSIDCAMGIFVLIPPGDLHLVDA
ncbi:cAMP-dependent protein kinase regulatory subunit PkaR [Talaromyces stipitatus ATCC 10500]|uniref:cAMP-dependent protein kinase regulatory subunit n=1 Tax=Talaromyces stipitatus (strain ATCC 10500 / CBS 375.48 / QM 6759 / NRRL 1006) TaxID=441959 RepID=B8LUQ6_TALSN|nr:cAMP-dependent protein kinase regulatory subunit PkaR [Talaromyces stipitatus ATCC 10500]EED23913.1 cAMP-dependent protein kinase regulatory subunit PkaR [Talaromyces stipitatus ATCC 10500]